jgi:hypothetical protein
MHCLSCGGAFEWAGNGQYARCTRCLALFNNQNGQLTPIQVQAPGGGNNPDFNAMFAQNLGFGPPPQQQQHNLAAGTFDMGGGQHLELKINGKSPEGFLKDKASSMIWGWIIGAVIIGILVLGGIGLAGYIFFAAKSGAAGATGVATGAAAKWDGKSTLTCAGNDVISLVGVKANVSGTAVKASGNCDLTLTGVDITAATGIEASANAKVKMTGGSIKATTNSVVASAAAKVDCTGTTVTGKSKASGAAKVTGAN